MGEPTEREKELADKILLADSEGGEYGARVHRAAEVLHSYAAEERARWEGAAQHVLDAFRDEFISAEITKETAGRSPAETTIYVIALKKLNARDALAKLLAEKA